MRRGPKRPDVVACLVQPAVGFPQRVPPQVLAGVDQRAPAEEGPLPDLLTGDRVRGLQLTAGALRAAGIRASGFWEPGGAGAWYSGMKSGAPPPRRRAWICASATTARSSWVPPANWAKIRRTHWPAGPLRCRSTSASAPNSGSAAATIASTAPTPPAPAAPHGCQRRARRRCRKARRPRAAQRAPDQQRRHQRPGLAPVGQAGHDPPTRGEFVRQRREPGTARQRFSIEGCGCRKHCHSR